MAITYNYGMRRNLTALFVSVFIFVIPLFSVSPSTSPYGINVHLAGNLALNRVKASGIKWMRIDISWFVCEPSPGVYNFTEVDRLVNYAAAKNLSLLAVIAYTPDWANSSRGRNYPAGNVYFWKRFVQQCLKRYKNRIKYWSLWNEPNVREFFAPGKDVFVQEVFLPGARIIRSADPAAFIVGPDLAHLTSVNQEWFLWMKYIFQQAGQFVDVVSHHVYDSRGAVYIYELLEEGEPLIPSVRKVLEENGMGDRPFWITETGWNTLAVSESVQSARYLEILQHMKLKKFPDRMFFYELLDDVNPQVSSWGIIHSDLSEKPAYSVITDYIAGKYPEPDPEIEEKERDCYAEKVFPNTTPCSKISLLNTLRGLRHDLVRFFPAGESWADKYYMWGESVYSLTGSDSRLSRLSREIIRSVSRSYSVRGMKFWTKKVEPELAEKAARWLSIAGNYTVPEELGIMFRFIESRLGDLAGEPLSRWIEKLDEFAVPGAAVRR